MGCSQSGIACRGAATASAGPWGARPTADARTASACAPGHRKTVARGAGGAGATPRLVTRSVSAVFWTPHDGLLAVRYCVPGSSHCVGGAVERTTDGGRTYRVVLRTRQPITDVERVGARGAIATPLFGEALR